MLKRFFSRYSLRYPRSLVYMLQASEYNVSDYLEWLCSAQNFRAIEVRKSLVRTQKSTILLAFAWTIATALAACAVGAFFLDIGPFRYLAALIVIAAGPAILAYALLIPLWILQITVQRPLEKARIEATRKSLESHKALKIAIAGSFGKTTMRELLRTVLSEGKKVAAPPHSHNTPAGLAAFVEGLAGDEDILVFELGEYYPGDVRELCDMIRPDIGVITGINEAHLKRFKTLEQTANAIYELADFLDGKPLYVNGESGLALAHIRQGNVAYSRAGIGGWRIERPETGLEGTAFALVQGGIRLDLNSGILGLHNVGPLAAAAAIALELGLSPTQIARGVAKTKPFNHRLEPRMDGSGVVTIDDSYNGNPDGVRAAIDFLSGLVGRRRLYVTPGLVEMGARAEAVHREIGRLLAQAGIEKTVLIRNSATPSIEAGLKDAGYKGEIVWFDAALAAFAALPHLTAAGDVVLLQNDWPDQYK